LLKHKKNKEWRCPSGVEDHEAAAVNCMGTAQGQLHSATEIHESCRLQLGSRPQTNIDSKTVWLILDDPLGNALAVSLSGACNPKTRLELRIEGNVE